MHQYQIILFTYIIVKYAILQRMFTFGTLYFDANTLTQVQISMQVQHRCTSTTSSTLFESSG